MMKPKIFGPTILLLCLLLILIHACQPRVDPSRLNLVIILIDTLRADHLGCYGYARSTSPNIDRLAARGTLFENAVAPSSWTLPSTASLLTGLYPTRHQVSTTKSRLPDWRETLGEILAEHGYETAAVVSHVFVSSEYNLQQGFDFFDQSHIHGHRKISSPGVTDSAIQWLRETRQAPFFLFLHYFDPHYAYLEHEGYQFADPYDGWVDPRMKFRKIQNCRGRLDAEDTAYIQALYDGEVAFTDHHVGLVLEELRRLGFEESTLVVLTADHGEEFMEHGWLGHTAHLYEETVHVPLVLRNPRMKKMPERFRSPVELIDVIPTVLEMMGIDGSGGEIQGQSLLDALEGKAPPDSVAFSEVSVEHIHRPDKESPYGEHSDLRSVRAGNLKCIYDVAEERWEAYDLASDPGETTNLAAGETGPQAAAVQRMLLDWVQEQERLALAENVFPDTLRAMSEEAEENLRALGYIQ